MKHHGMQPLRGHQACPFLHHEEGKFSRMFPELYPAYVDPGLLKDLGKAGGIMQGPKTSLKSKTVTLGFVFLGQFIDHDISLDVTSTLDQRNDPFAIRNFRTPALDLDCIYGSGPEATPFLYDDAPAPPLRDHVMKLGAKGIDLPRIGKKALIGDPRNDENRIISQLQLAFLKFHNAVMKHMKGSVPDGELFEKAREKVRWQYQWIILRDFLPRMIGTALTEEILCFGPKFYHQHGRPYIPVEFSAAAYRFGHSMVTNSMHLNQKFKDVEFFGDEMGLGFTPVQSEDHTVYWPFYFETKTKGVSVQFAAKLDAKLAPELMALPFANDDSLATRNLLRGQSFGLPSGQAVAEEMGLTTLTASKLGLSGVLGACTPLWYYILKEAELESGGEHLGQVGGRIVGETLVGLMQGDETSMLYNNPGWEPDLPRIDGSTSGPFTMGDLLHFAGVV